MIDESKQFMSEPTIGMPEKVDGFSDDNIEKPTTKEKETKVYLIDYSELVHEKWEDKVPPGYLVLREIMPDRKQVRSLQGIFCPPPPKGVKEIIITKVPEVMLAYLVGRAGEFVKKCQKETGYKIKYEVDQETIYASEWELQEKIKRFLRTGPEKDKIDNEALEFALNLPDENPTIGHEGSLIVVRWKELTKTNRIIPITKVKRGINYPENEKIPTRSRDR